MDDDVLLSARVVPYGKKQRLLLAADITRVRQLSRCGAISSPTSRTNCARR